MTLRDPHGVHHLVLRQIRHDGVVMSAERRWPDVGMVQTRCGKTAFASFDLTDKPVDCMVCLVKEAR